MKIKVVNKSKHQPPFYSTPLSADLDIRADIAEWVTVDNLIDTERGTGGFGHTGKE